MLMYILLVCCQLNTPGALPPPAPIDDLLAIVSKGPTPEARRVAIRALLARRDLPPKAPPIVLKAIHDRDRETRAAVTELLGAFADKQSIRLLIDLSENDREQSVRMAAMAALAKLGPIAKKAIPSLIRVMQEPIKPRSLDGFRLDSVHRSAALALGAIGGDAVPPLVEVATNRDCDVWIRELAVKTICVQGSRARRAIPSMVKLTRDPDEEFRLHVIEWIGSIDPESREIRRALLGALADESSYVRVVAAGALHAVDKDDVISVPVLVHALDDGVVRTQWRALAELGRLGVKALPAASAIAGKLGSDEASIREHAAAVLGELGPSAHAVLPRLVKASGDPDEGVRDAVKCAIEKIRAKPSK